ISLKMCASQSKAGLLSWEQFIHESNAFLKVSQILNDGWKSEVLIENPYGFYLTKTQLCSIESNCEQKMFEESDEQEFIENVKIVKFEYHIVYSQSYLSPILYFRAINSNGSHLNIEEIWDLIPQAYKLEHTAENKYSIYSKMITQMDHVLLGKPYFAFHPCQTTTFMSEINYSLPQKSYILTWLSTIAPFVGLKLSLDYVTEFQKRNINKFEKCSLY
ncbi:ubiquitin-like-conjugating enzyme ATG10, partial [Leptotrombidium deliense]